MGVVVSRCGAPELPFKGRSLVDWLNGSGGRRSAPASPPPAERHPQEAAGAVGGEPPPPPPPPELPAALEPVLLGGGWSRQYDVANLRFQRSEETGRLQVLVPEVVLGPGRPPRVRHVLCGERAAASQRTGREERAHSSRAGSGFTRVRLPVTAIAGRF